MQLSEKEKFALDEMKITTVQELVSLSYQKLEERVNALIYHKPLYYKLINLAHDLNLEMYGEEEMHTKLVQKEKDGENILLSHFHLPPRKFRCLQSVNTFSPHYHFQISNVSDILTIIDYINHFSEELFDEKKFESFCKILLEIKNSLFDDAYNVYEFNKIFHKNILSLFDKNNLKKIAETKKRILIQRAHETPETISLTELLNNQLVAQLAEDGIFTLHELVPRVTFIKEKKTISTENKLLIFKIIKEIVGEGEKSTTLMAESCASTTTSSFNNQTINLIHVELQSNASIAQLIDKLNQENESIRSRIKSKGQLLEKYFALIKEKESLLQQEQVLENQIEQALATLEQLNGGLNVKRK